MGMFTSRDVQQTKDWISEIVYRDVPVGSIDSFVTWEKTMPNLSTLRDESGKDVFKFYRGIRENPDFKQRVIQEVLLL